MTGWIRRALPLRGAALAAVALAVVARAPDARGDDRAEARRAGPDRTPSDVHNYALRPVDDGTFLYEGNGFSAVIQRDGAVEFHPEHWKTRTAVGEAITNTGRGWQPKAWPVPLPSEYRPTWYDDRERQLRT